MFSINPEIPPLKAIEILEATSDALDGVPRQDMGRLGLGYGRVNFWKAMLVAANGHLSTQADRSAGPDTLFSTLEASNDGEHVHYYGMEVRTSEPGASIWRRTGTPGNYAYEPLGNPNDPAPIAFVPAVGQPQASPAVTYAAVPRDEPYFPWGAGVLGAANTQYAVSLTVARQDLCPPGAIAPTLIVAGPNIDPRQPPVVFQPVIEVQLGDLQAMRNPEVQPDGSPIQIHVRSFDDFVFVISVGS